MLNNPVLFPEVIPQPVNISEWRGGKSIEREKARERQKDSERGEGGFKKLEEELVVIIS